MRCLKLIFFRLDMNIKFNIYYGMIIILNLIGEVLCKLI